ncbi:cupin domain-containing protein [Myceligenerans cantabricum]
MAEPAVFPGGTSVSHLRVYDWPAPDAPGGSGTPHFHTVSTEAYVVLGGRGRVETLGPQGYSPHDLAPGRIVWFSPGVIHRAVNEGGLEVLVVMSDAGLPEAGDAVLTFPPEILASAEAYRDEVTLPAPAAPEAPSARDRAADGLNPPDDMAEDPSVAAAALARRELALEGYRALRRAVEADGPSALDPLYEAASRLVGVHAEHWRDLWATTAGRAASATDQALVALAGVGAPAEARPQDATAPTAAVEHLRGGAVAEAGTHLGPRRYGMCGRLRVWSARGPSRT